MTLPYLFNQNGPSTNNNNNAYYVDQLLVKYMSTGILDSVLNTTVYFQGSLNNNLVLDMQNNDLSALSSLTNVKKLRGTGPNANAPSSPNGTTPGGAMANQCLNGGAVGSASAGMTGMTAAVNPSDPNSYLDPYKVDFDIRISRNQGYDCTPNQQCQIEEILKSIDSAISSVSNSTAISQDYKTFDNYLNEIMMAMCMYNFKYCKDAMPPMKIDPSNATTETPQQRTARLTASEMLEQATRNIKSFTGSRFNDMSSLLRKTSKAALYEIVEQTARLVNYSTSPMSAGADPSSYSTESLRFIQDFANFNDSTVPNRNKLYYMYFKQLMLEKLQINQDIFIEPRKTVELVMKKFMIDLYIKACYPLIHFDLIGAMLEYYTNKGDFVNSRIALFAKAVFVFNIVNELLDRVPSTVTIPTSLSQSFYTNLLNYYNNIKKPDIRNPSSENEQIKNILVSLHKSSNNVVDTSDNVNKIKYAIKDNQVSLRSVSGNQEELRKGIYWRNVEFYIILAVTLALIGICIALMILSKPMFVLIAAASYIGVIVVYQLILVIINFVRKN
jgi:hypothetical protein